MGKKGGNSKANLSTKERLRNKLDYNKNHPMVSICTPTFNRRPFIPYMIKCFEHQDYPMDRIEWIIIDDGTDKIGEMVSHIPQVKYFAYDTKMTLGKKRNLMHDKSTGDIIVYMDDDDYYPPERISHAVDTLLKNPRALCAGSSEMYIYFKHIQKMYQFGPYGPNHATAATFAFHRRLLDQTRYNEEACVAEEKDFLKNYTVPFVQLNPLKSILVFSHIHNSFDKKTLLKDAPNQFVKESTKTVDNFVKESDLKQFYMEDVNQLLDHYEPGKPENKPDVTKQLEELRISREKMMLQQQQQAQEQMKNNPVFNGLNNKINEQNVTIHELTTENQMLKDKMKYLEEKITKLIKEQIDLKRQIVKPEAEVIELS